MKKRTKYSPDSYEQSAIDHGYSDYTPEQLKEVGMAIERAYCEWSWYVAGEERGGAVSQCFADDEEPTEDALVQAYAEGMVC